MEAFTFSISLYCFFLNVVIYKYKNYFNIMFARTKRKQFSMPIKVVLLWNS